MREYELIGSTYVLVDMAQINGIPHARSVDVSMPYLHIATYSAPVSAERFPNGEIVDSHDDRAELEQWAIDYKNDNPGVATSYVIANPLSGSEE